MASRGLALTRAKFTALINTNRPSLYVHHVATKKTKTTPSYWIQQRLCHITGNGRLRGAISTVGRRRQQIRSLSSSSSSNGASGGGDGDDYFRVFGIERTYSISLPQLQSTYRSLMASIHPDVHYSKTKDDDDDDEEEEGKSTSNNNEEDLATVVTRGHSVLKDPHARALHLLELLGCPMEDTASGDIVGQEFLMEIMELREEVDSIASSSSSSSSDTTGLRAMREKNDLRIRETCEAIGAAFDGGNYEDARRWTAVLQYWNRLGEEIDKRDDD